MPEPIQQKPNQDPISVPVGGPEGTPVSVPEAQTQGIEQYVQPASQEVDPNVPAEASQFVQVKRDPGVDQEAQNVGVSPSLPPVGDGYVPPAWKTVEEAKAVRKNTKPDKSMAWIATEAIKRFDILGFFGRKKEATQS